MKIPAFNFNFIKYIDKQTLSRSGILFVMIVIFIFMCVLPSAHNQKKLKDKAKELENSVIRSIRKINDYPQMKDEKLRVEAYVNEYLDRLVFERDKTKLIGDVSDLAKKTNVKIISMRPEQIMREWPEEFLTHFKPLAYELDVECGYHEFGKFLNDLEHFDIILHVDEIHIDPNPENENIHNIKVKLSTYAKI